MENRDLLTKRETARLVKERLLMSVGRYSSYCTLRPNETRRTVFVCKGNICRSALAESYMNQKGLPTASFGLDCDDGRPANAMMLKIAEVNGLPLHDHKTTSADSFEFKQGDLLVAMEPSQATRLIKIIGASDHTQIALLGMFLTPRRPTIIDPYGREKRLFEEIASIIFQGVDNLHSLLSKSGY